MRAVRFADGFDGPDTVAFGLDAPRLATVLTGGMVAWALSRSALPGAVRLPAAVIVAVTAAAMGWVRIAGHPLLRWAWLGARFVAAPRSGGMLAATTTPPDPQQPPAPAGIPLPAAQPGPGWTRSNGEKGGPGHGDRGAGTEPRPLSHDGPVAREEDPVPADGEEPPWARWLREGGARRPGPGGAVPNVPGFAPGESAAPGDAAGDTPAHDDGADAAGRSPDGETVDPATTGARPPTRAPHPVGVDAGEPPTVHGRPGLLDRLRRAVDRRRAMRSGEPTAAEGPVVAAEDDPPRSTVTPAASDPDVVEIDRPALVLLPEPPLQSRPDPDAAGADGDDPGEPSPEADATPDPPTEDGGASPDVAVVIPLRRHDDVLELADGADVARAASATEDHHDDARAGGDHASAQPVVAAAPVFVGAPRRIAFFSLNGGSGRTTLATEVACVLAARGLHREHPAADARPLEVALLDLDLRSANVAVRLGVPQPTILDLLLDTRGDVDAVTRHMVRHRTGLRALLGPPKPLGSGSAPPLEPARVAEVLHDVEAQGAQFVVIDLGADLGAVTTWVLGAVHDIFVVLTPSASGLQDAYRTTETLRRMGVGHKLRYVVNRARGDVDMSVVMDDLRGRIAAVIPYDPRVEEAENAHRSVAVDGDGPAAAAIARLAAQVYPALRPLSRRGRLGRLGRRGLG